MSKKALGNQIRIARERQHLSQEDLGKKFGWQQPNVSRIENGLLSLDIDQIGRLAGIPVVLVNPRNTSRTCPSCGCIDKRNRLNQSTFSCIRCGLAGLADAIAAVNIRRGAVDRPDISAAQSTVQSQG